MDMCANCRNYLSTPNPSDVPTNQHGLCRAHSPAAFMANNPTGTFPGVQSDWWCAEHNSAPAPHTEQANKSEGWKNAPADEPVGGWRAEGDSNSTYTADPANGGFKFNPNPDTLPATADPANGGFKFNPNPDTLPAGTEYNPATALPGVPSLHQPAIK